MVAQLNFFPAENGVSKTYSPWQIMGNPQLDYKKHFVASFGDYVQANQENIPSNDMRPRSLDCIYLAPNVFAPQGGHTLLSIETGHVITRPRIWKIPMTDLVIKAINKMGAEQGSRNKKVSGKANQIKLRPADWRTGVDCDGKLSNSNDNMKVKKVKKETKPDDSNDNVADDDDENGYDDETVAGDDIVVETVDEDEDSDDEEENTDESPPLDEEEVRKLLADEEPAPTNTPSMPTIVETVEEDDDDETHQYR